VADAGEENSPKASECRLECDSCRNGVSRNAGHFLFSRWLSCAADFLGFRQSLRQAVGRTKMDYLITLFASVVLFAYLLYALLKPERF